MHRVDNSSANAIKPVRANPGPKPNAYFDESTQTIVPADFLNAVQDEIANVIEEDDGVLDKNDDTQLVSALRARHGRTKHGVKAATILAASLFQDVSYLSGIADLRSVIIQPFYDNEFDYVVAKIYIGNSWRPQVVFMNPTFNGEIVWPVIPVNGDDVVIRISRSAPRATDFGWSPRISAFGA